jgi:hypothetical protein
MAFCDDWLMFSYPRGKGPKEHLNGDSVKRTRGRPKGSGLKADKTRYAIRVTEATRIDLDQWKREFHVGTYDEAIREFIKSNTERQKKVEGQDLEILNLQEESNALKQAIESHLRIQKRHAEIIAELEDRLNAREPIILEMVTK